MIRNYPISRGCLSKTRGGNCFASLYRSNELLVLGIMLQGILFSVFHHSDLKKVGRGSAGRRYIVNRNQA
jgi:hypothetical protein